MVQVWSWNRHLGGPTSHTRIDGESAEERERVCDDVLSVLKSILA